MKKLNITFCSFPDFSGNAKALYEFMVKKYEDNMNYTWIVYNISTVELLKAKGINAILIGSDEFKEYIPKTNVFFTTHANLAGDKSKAKNSIYIELWHGIGPKPVGFLTKKMKKSDVNWYNYIKEIFDYIIVPSEYWKVIASAMFNVESSRILTLGLPLLDEIKFSDGKKNIYKLINVDLDKYNGIIYYFPTFKKGCGRELESSYNENQILNLYDYDDKDLIKYLEQKNYLLVVKRHPSDECEYAKPKSDNIVYIENDDLEKMGMNVNNILNAADIMITDYSSVGLELAFLDKPILYLDTDLEEYTENRGIIFDDYDFWTNGNMISSYKELIESIDLKIKKSEVLKNKEKIFGNLKNGGCEDICNFLFNNNYQIKSGVVRHESNFSEMMQKIEEKDEKIMQLKLKLKENNFRLSQIENSKGWKLLEKLRKIMKF